MITIGITEFAKRQTDKDHVGTKLTENQLERLRVMTVNKLNMNVDVNDGYAPFCKEVVIRDQVLKCPIAEITDDNKRLLESNYHVRKEGELPYLSRYFPKGSVKPVSSHHITVIIYTKEQMEQEKDSSGADYDIVAVLAEAQPGTSPMSPSTMLRNALGKEYGGSGVEIDHEKYMESVAYWSKYAMIES